MMIGHIFISFKLFIRMEIKWTLGNALEISSNRAKWHCQVALNNVIVSKEYIVHVLGNQVHECVLENYFLNFSSKTCVVGTQKSTQNTCLN